MVPITLGSIAPLVVKIGTKRPKTPIFGRFWILTPNQILNFFVLLETSLAFEKAVNLPYWKAKLNVRIFVYIENKKILFGQILNLYHGRPRAHFKGSIGPPAGSLK